MTPTAPQSRRCREPDWAAPNSRVWRACFLIVSALAIGPFPLCADPLPIPCVACGHNAVPFAAPGVATTSTNANTLLVTQHPERAVLNWQSFNIANGNTVRFEQPSTNAVALNRIFQNSPSEIFGKLTANGQLFLINQNGIVFGSTAQVDVNSLVASSLDMHDEVFKNLGIAGAINDPSGARPAFAGVGPLGPVSTEAGAQLHAAEGGRIMLLAPRVENRGNIETPGGQTILAGSNDKVYLAAADGDPNLRGLLVEVETGGTATNAGTISAPRGNITLVGYAVNQNGRASATTSVSVNGSVRLLARDKVQIVRNDVKNTNQPTALHGGILTLGANSRTEVNPVPASTNTDPAKTKEEEANLRLAVDAQPQPISKIEIFGNKVTGKSGAQVTAPGGDIEIRARRNAIPAANETADAKLLLEAGSRIDASGLRDAVVSVERNLVKVELRGNELRDAPLQKNGPLRGVSVTIDARKGTPLADVSGALAGIKRPLNERLAVGGTVVIDSDNTLRIEAGASVDVSGGLVTYTGAFINTTKLLAAGRIYDIGNADPNRVYDGIFGQSTVAHSKWGISENYQLLVNDRANFEPGYSEGKDAGTVTIAAPNLSINGTLLGQTSADQFQRKRPGAALGFQRPFDELPLAGKLVLGRGSIDFNPAVAQDYLLNDVLLATTSAVGASTVETTNGLLLQVSPELFSAGQFGRAEIFSNGRIDIPQSTNLDLGSAGEFNLGAGVIHLDGIIKSAGGSITINALPTVRVGNGQVSLTLESGAALVTKGGWVNDRAARALGIADLGPCVLDGGRVTLNSIGNLDLQRGSLIDVSGGGQKTSTGAVVYGTGGAVTLSTDDVTPTTLTVAGDLRGFGFSKGGQLKITSGGFGIQSATSAFTDLTSLDPNRFGGDGFADVQITATRNGISVAPGTRIDLRQRNRIPNNNLESALSGTDIDTISHVGYLADHQRLPTALSLSYKRRANLPVVTSEISLGTGSFISADPGSKISLSSDTRLFVDGTIDAPAGEIALTLLNPREQNDRGFDSAQAITLGSSSALLARGSVRLIPNAVGTRRGEVLGGGSVKVKSQRGYILANRGSTVDVSGTSAVFDLSDPTRPSTLSPTTINAIGGRIEFTAAEGMLLNGDFTGHGGGNLSIALDPLGRETSADLTGLPQFPTGPRTIIVGTATPPDLRHGDNVAVSLNGLVPLETNKLLAGGFSALNLSTRPALVSNGAAAIRFDGDQALTLPQSINLDTPVLASNGGAVSIAAPYIRLGNTDDLSAPRRVVAPTIGSGRLRIDAAQIDLVGDLSLQGFGNAVALASAGDLRLIGTRVPANQSTEFVGSFNTAGDISFNAARIYPTTLSDFRISTHGVGQVLVTSFPNNTNLPLSAGGSLVISAPTIIQSGVVLAPFGQITLDGSDSVTLASGSLTSTSGANLLIPFGQTQFGRQWVYPLGTVTRLITAAPEKRIALSSSNLTIASGATVDLSGGGDLLASEHIPGPGGSSDILAAANPAGSFAILPALASQFAAYDPLESRATSFDSKSTIELAGITNLAPGTYAMLPARYALLPGAFLLTPVKANQEVVPALAGQMSNGVPLIAGRVGSVGESVSNTQWHGYRVESGADWRLRGEYRETLASSFFATVSKTENTIATRLPIDAGSLSLTASKTLLLAGKLQAAAPVGGRGAEMDIAAEHLAIVREFSGATDRVEIRADDLNGFRAQSLLLGGRRRPLNNEIALDIVARNVTLEPGVDLKLPELLVTARDDIVLDAGAKVTAGGEQVSRGRPYTIAGDGALLIASTGAQTTVTHTAQFGATGSIDLRSGASVFAPGSIALDGSRDTVVNGTLVTNQGSLRLASSRISLGDVAGVTGGLVLSNEKLQALKASEWIFDSRSTVDLYGPITAQVANMTIDAAGIVGHANVNNSVSLTAKNILLSNPNGRSDPSLTSVSNAVGSSLTLHAREITLGPGAFSIAGFEQVALDANDQIVGVGKVGVSSTGSLALTTNRLTASSGGDLTLRGARAIFRLPNTPASFPRTTSLGGRISVAASDIDFGGRIELPAGELNFLSTAAAGITVRDTAAIDLAASSEVFGGKQIAVSGGRFKAKSDAGSILIEANAVLDVAGSGGGDGGLLSFTASNGSINIAPGTILKPTVSDRGGSFLLDAETLGGDTDFTALNTSLNAAGFTRQRAFRLRRGNLMLAPNAAIRASDLTLTTDSGTIDIFGTLDAHGGEAGRIALNARDNLTLHAAARLDAHATTPGQLGGEVSLRTTNGNLVLEATDTPGAYGINVAGTTATQDAHGAAVAMANGSVVLRAPRTNNAEVAVNSAAVTIAGASRTDLEAFNVYSGTVVGSVFPAALNDADSFMTHAEAIETRLARNTDQHFHLVPGIEIKSSTSLTLDSTLDLLQTRFNGEPGVLTLRASTDLLLNGTLSDGLAHVPFIDPGTGGIIPELGERDTVQTGPSWSYHLAAGADLASADLNTVRSGAGNLVIATNRQLRTGTGSISIATGGDLRLTGLGSAVYTVGENRGPGAFDPIFTEGLMRADFIRSGGNIRVDSLGSIYGVATPVLPDWLSRIGGANTQLGQDVPTAWAINAAKFQQGIGALAGGRVSVTTAGDLTDLVIAIPTNGLPTLTGGVAGVAIEGGGAMQIGVGGDIRSGTFLLGRGNARIRADGVVRSPNSSVATVLEVGDAQIDLSARGSVQLESVFNPTLAPVSPTQSADSFGNASSVFFSTYTPVSRVTLTALSGDTVLENETTRIRAPYGDRNFGTGEILALTLFPGSFQAASLRGDLVLKNSLILAPSNLGQLDLLADRNLRTPNVVTTIRLTDTDPLLLPSAAKPFNSLVTLSDLLLSEAPGIGHAATPIHTLDPATVHIIARSGDIGSTSNNRLEITVAKQALIEAGTDILNLSFTNQHVAATDHTVIHAGRDVLFSTLRNPLGVLQLNQTRFEFSGPGRFDVLAGRDVDLGTSNGVLSTGRLRNPALPMGGGSVTVMAGLAAEPEYLSFAQRYLQDSTLYDDRLSTFLAQYPNADTGILASRFLALPREAQRGFLLSVFFNELKESGIAASKAGVTANNYSRGFNAIHTLFSNTNGHGDIISLLSRISTLDGGDINLVAPYGLVNAGAAAATGLAKSPSELGIVIQRNGNLSAYTASDFLVNSSRVFALDGGNILIWSSHGNIDAGRGAKSALSIPPPVVSFDALGNVITEFPPAVSGSGIQAAVSTVGRPPGDVFLFAPGGIIDAGDAGIASAGNLTIAATAVLGADNISVGGVASGVPTTTVSVPVGLASASAAASSASNAATQAASQQVNDKDTVAKDLARSLVSVISVEFLGFGN